MNTREHMAAKYDRSPIQNDKAVLGSENREWMKAGFKPDANSTSPNVNKLRESTTPIEEPIEATIRFEYKKDDQPIGKGNIKKQWMIKRS